MKDLERIVRIIADHPLNPYFLANLALENFPETLLRAIAAEELIMNLQDKLKELEGLKYYVNCVHHKKCSPDYYDDLCRNCRTHQSRGD